MDKINAKSLGELVVEGELPVLMFSTKVAMAEPLTDPVKSDAVQETVSAITKACDGQPDIFMQTVLSVALAHYHVCTKHNFELPVTLALIGDQARSLVGVMLNEIAAKDAESATKTLMKKLTAKAA